MSHSKRKIFAAGKTKTDPRTDGIGRSVPTSFRFSEEAKDILFRLSAFEGLSQTSFIEQMLRREARERGILPSMPAPLSPKSGDR